MLWENKCAIALLSLAMAVSLRYCINTSEDGLAYTNSIFSLVVWGGYAAILLWIKNQGLWERLFPFLKTGFVLMLFFAKYHARAEWIRDLISVIILKKSRSHLMPLPFSAL